MTYHAGGWNLTALTGAGLGVALLILFACEHSFARR
jgi:hypothetical protein